jgi:hypothetical protein
MKLFFSLCFGGGLLFVYIIGFIVCMVKDIISDYKSYKKDGGKRNFIGFLFKEEHPNFFYSHF